MSIVRPILHHGLSRPDATAIVDGPLTVTYGELALQVRRTTSRFRALGLGSGNRIGLCLADTAAHIVAILAAAHAGGVAVPLDWRARPVENGRFADALGIKFVLAEPGIRLTSHCAVVSRDAEWERAVASAEVGHDGRGSWAAPFVISASSGSTGVPKFTQMTHYQYYFAVAGMWELMRLSGPHRFLCNLPLYYSGGRNSCIAHLLRGDCVILHPSLFRADEYVEIANRQRATVGVVVPSMVRQLLALPERAAPLLGDRPLFSTGAPLHAEEKRAAAQKLTPHFHERYGTAETLVVAALHPEDFAERADSVGQPHSLAEIEIVDDDDRPLPHGAAGRLRCRGPGLASPVGGGASEASFRDGWFYPGEIAWLDARGYIFLQGRVSEVILRSGAKVFPAEVEQALREHGAVADAAVIGLPASMAEEDSGVRRRASRGGRRRAPSTLPLALDAAQGAAPHRIPAEPATEQRGQDR